MADYIEVTSNRGAGAKVRAVGTGKVADVGYRPGYGDHTVVVEYDEGPFVLYGYNQATRVVPRERVYTNTVLAEMGCEGNCREHNLGARVHIRASNTFEGLFNGGESLLDPRAVFDRINKNPPPTAAPYTPSTPQLGRMGGSSGNASTVGDFINTFRKAVGAPYRWGAGHGDGIGLKELQDKGADASGVFNIVRREIGLINPEIGSFTEYFAFLESLRPVELEDEPGKGMRFPVGTVLINPVAGHMAMVHNVDGQLLEAHGETGISDSRTIYDANLGWEGFTHAGVMPDVGTYGPPPELQALGSLGEGFGPRMDPEMMKAQGKEASGNFEGDDTASMAGWLGPTHWDVQPYIKERADKIADKCGVQWNTYTGHQYRDGATEDTTVDFWGGERGTRISPEQAQCVRDEVLNNYCDDAMYMISDGNMYDTPEAGGVYHWSDDDEEGHFNHTHVSWNGNGLGSTCEGAGGTGAKKGAGAAAASDPEPCIMRNPLGPYKLIAGSPGFNNSAMVRSAALNAGDFTQWPEFQQRVMDKLHGDGYDAVKSIIDEQIAAPAGTRYWPSLGELKRVPYMGAIQDVAAAGLYSFNSVGTGEIVFWYPDIIMELTSSELSQDPLNNMEDASQRESFLNGLTPDQQAAYVQGLSANQIHQRFPSLTDDQIDALMEAAQNRTEEGLEAPFDRTTDNSAVDTSNVDILNQRLILQDIELIDFHLYMSDEELVTHYFIMGDYRLEGQMPADVITNIKCWMWSDIFHHPYFNALKDSSGFDPDAFIQRYGSRTKKEEVPTIKLPGMAQLWADNELLKQWFNCYTVQLQITFMPQLYPGMTIEVASLGLVVQVLSVNITYGDSWTTQVDCAIRGKTANSKLPGVPFWEVGDENDTRVPRNDDSHNPNNDPSDPRPQTTPTTSPGATPSPSTPSSGVITPSGTPALIEPPDNTIGPAPTTGPQPLGPPTLEDLRRDFEDRTREALDARDAWLETFQDPDARQAILDALQAREDERTALEESEGADV